MNQHGIDIRGTCRNSGRGNCLMMAGYQICKEEDFDNGRVLEVLTRFWRFKLIITMTSVENTSRCKRGWRVVMSQLRSKLLFVVLEESLPVTDVTIVQGRIELCPGRRCLAWRGTSIIPGGARAQVQVRILTLKQSYWKSSAGNLECFECYDLWTWLLSEKWRERLSRSRWNIHSIEDIGDD